MLKTMQTVRVVPTDTGSFWAFRISEGRGSRVGCCSTDGNQVDDFARSLAMSSSCIRVVGVDVCAPLITTLYLLQQSGDIDCRIQIGSPESVVGIPEHKAGLDFCEAVLHNTAERDKLHPSCGGWHDIDRIDYINYGLIQFGGDISTDYKRSRAVNLLKEHPTWNVFSFMPGCQTTYAIRLLTSIKDPRWFVNPTKPDETSRLRSYLGLTRTNMRALVDPAESKGRHFNRAMELFKAYGGEDYVGSCRPDGLRRFLYKHASDIPLDRGLLLACNTFLLLLRSVWLDATYPYSDLFVVSSFFDEQESEEFLEHVENIRN